MASFFSALVGGYAQTALARQQNEQKREDAGKLAEMNALGIAIDSGRLTDEGFNAAIGRIEELSDTRSKKGAESPLRSILTKLRGQVPKEKRYQAQTLDQTVQGQGSGGKPSAASVLGPGARGMAGEQPEGDTSKGRAPTGSQAGITKPRTFLTQKELEDRAARQKAQEYAVETDALMARAKAVNKAAGDIKDPDARRSFLAQMHALPPQARIQRTVVKDPDPNSTTGWRVEFSDESGAPLGSISNVAPPAGEKAVKVTAYVPGEATPIEAMLQPGGMLTTLDGKPLPDGSQALPPASYLQKQPTVTSSTRVGPEGIESQTSSAHGGGGIVLPGGGSNHAKMPKGPPASSTTGGGGSGGSARSTGGGAGKPGWAPPKSIETQALKDINRGISLHAYYDTLGKETQTAAANGGKGTTAGDRATVEAYMQLMFGRDPKALRGSPQMMEVLTEQGGWDQRAAAAIARVMTGSLLTQELRQQMFDQATRQIGSVDDAVSRWGTIEPSLAPRVTKYKASVGAKTSSSNGASSTTAPPSGGFKRDKGGVYVEE